MVAVTDLTKTTPYRKHTKVRSTTDLPGVPEGTDGKVKMSQGITWLRYWVQFDNGVWLGSVDHSQVVPVKEWDDHLRRQEEAARRAAEAPDPAESAGAGEAVAAAGGESKVVNGVAVPPHLLERSKSARQRLGA